MGKSYLYIKCLLMLFMLFLTINKALAAVLTFDDLSGGPLPSNYGGFDNWSGGQVVNSQSYDSASYIRRGAVSGDNVIVINPGSWQFNEPGFVIWLNDPSNESFDFEGFYLASRKGYGGMNVEAFSLGYDNNNPFTYLSYSTYFTFYGHDPHWFNFNYKDIYALHFYSSDLLAMDNFTYNLKTIVPQIPEPGTIFMFSSLMTGLFGFAGFRKRFKIKADVRVRDVLSWINSQNYYYRHPKSKVL